MPNHGTKRHVTIDSKFIFCKFPHVEKFRRQWNVNHIYSNKNSEMKNVLGNEEIEKFVDLAGIFGTAGRIPQI